MRMLVILGEGGHTKEIISLIDDLGEDIEYGYVVVDDDDVTPTKIQRTGPVFRVRRPRDKEHHFVRDVFRTMQSGWQSWRVLRQYKPDAVLTSGPSVAVPACIGAKLLGRKVIFCETGSRITQLSLTGRIMIHVADLFFVQWPELAKRYRKAVYLGRTF